MYHKCLFFIVCISVFSCIDEDIPFEKANKLDIHDLFMKSLPNVNQQGYNYGTIYRDERSGSRITAKVYNDHKLYQTHKNWSFDGNWMIFTSYRNGSSIKPNSTYEYNNNIFAMNMPDSNDGVEDYIIVQLTHHEGLRDLQAGSGGASLPDIVISGTRNVLYWPIEHLNGSGGTAVSIIELDFGKLIADALLVNQGSKSSMGWPGDYNRVVCSFVNGNPVISGGMSLDFNENYIYIGLGIGSTTGLNRLMRVNVANGSESIIHDSYNYPICHIQANPWISNQVLFCYLNSATLGQAQRMHLINGDGTNYRPLFQTYENVTHETWIGPYEIGFNVAPGSQNMSGLYKVYSFGYGPYALTSSSTPEMEYISHVKSPISNIFILDEGYEDGRHNWGTESLIKYDQLTGQKTHLFSGNGTFFAHQSISPDGRWLLFESRDVGYNLHLIELQ